MIFFQEVERKSVVLFVGTYDLFEES